jgi:transposase
LQINNPGIETHVIQSSSVPVDRRARRAKSDGIDAELLLRTVPIFAETDEDARRRVRERAELVADQVGIVNRIGAVLATLGVGEYNPIRRDRRQRLDELWTALGGSLPTHARAKIVRMLDRLKLLLIQITELEKSRDAVLEA